MILAPEPGTPIRFRCPGLGVGKGLLEKARESIGPAVSLILVSMPESVGFYDKIGMPRL